MRTSGSCSSTLLQLTSLDGNVTYVTYIMLSIRMQVSVQSLKKCCVVATVVVQLFLKGTQVYVFPTLISVFGNKKQT